MKTNTIWIIAGIIIAILLIVMFYYNFVKQPQPISVNIKLNSENTTIYPYQLIYATANITNTGKTDFKAVPFGVIYNGSLVDIYNISLPAGEHTLINFTQEPTAPGNYSLEVVVDPNQGSGTISNSSTIKTSIYFNVIPEENPKPAEILSNNNTYEKLQFQDGESYVVTSYLNKDYGLSIFSASDIPSINAFLTPILNLTYSYIKNIYSAEAIYKNSTVYSFWIQGPLTQNLFYQAAKGANLTVINKTTKQNYNVVYIQVDKNTTMCSWYQGGWTKSLAVMGIQNCGSFINESTYNNTPKLQNANVLPYLGSNDMLENITFKSIPGNGYGKLFVINQSFVFESELPNLGGNPVCYGLINVVNNVSYCSTYIFKNNNNTIGPISLIDTKAYISNYNLSVISLINTTYALEQTNRNIQILKNINYNGVSENFSSGITNNCIFNASISCNNPTFGVNGLTMQLRDLTNQTFKLNKIACYNLGTPTFTVVNKTLGSGITSNVTIPCYENGNTITGVALGLYVNMIMNYTTLNKSYTAIGKAEIV